jgi:hypothetical protein
LINPFTESNASLIRAYVIFDFEDIREIHSARMVQVRFASGIDQTGKLLMADGVMRFVGSELAFERTDVVTILAWVLSSDQARLRLLPIAVIVCVQALALLRRPYQGGSDYLTTGDAAGELRLPVADAGS